MAQRGRSDRWDPWVQPRSGLWAQWTRWDHWGLSGLWFQHPWGPSLPWHRSLQKVQMDRWVQWDHSPLWVRRIRWTLCYPWGLSVLVVQWVR